MRRLSMLIALAALALGGCSESPGPPQTGPRTAPSGRGPHENGPHLNGLQLNGLQLNGLQLNGLQLNGLQLNGLQLNGLQLNGLQLNGLQLNGLQLNGLQLNGLQLDGTRFSARAGRHKLSGNDLIGLTFSVDVLEGDGAGAYLIRIDGIEADPTSPAGDVFLYDVQFRRTDAHGPRDARESWSSLCTDHDGNPVPALPLHNRWDSDTGARIDDPDTITFACASGALGKCVRWGYRPWATATRCSGAACTQVSLADYHQACTRMVRADYCGSGEPGTVDGTLIDVFDALAPQIQTASTGWALEAKWTPDGATCLGRKPREESLLRKLPDCNGNGRADDFVACEETPKLQPHELLASKFGT